MRKTVNRSGLSFMFGIAFCCALVIAFAGTTLAAEETFDCTKADQLEQEIVAEAELVDFTCFFKEWKNEECLHFMVKFKNISDTEQRFRVNIFLDNGKAVGGLLPRKTKSGLIQPGAVVEYAYPVRGMAQKPEGVFLRIQTMGS